jgi:hypothetical protein
MSSQAVCSRAASRTLGKPRAPWLTARPQRWFYSFRCGGLLALSSQAYRPPASSQAVPRFFLFSNNGKIQCPQNLTTATFLKLLVRPQI